MSTERISIKVQDADHADVEITIVSETGADLWVVSDDIAADHNESPYQLLEGCAYEYAVAPEGYQLQGIAGIVLPSKLRKSHGTGRITTRTYVGSLEIKLLKQDTGACCGSFQIEVRSAKMEYRSHYRQMLEDITEKCTELLLLHTSPVVQSFVPDFKADARTLYQRFAFVKSLIDSDDFSDALHKVLGAPVTRWIEHRNEQNISSIRRLGSKTIRQLAGARNRTGLPEKHPLRPVLPSVPARLTIDTKKETIDTPENRFIKHVLHVFSAFCNDLRTHARDNKRLHAEALKLQEKLEQFLAHSLFRDISDPVTLPLNSPVLQRKEGYREVLRSWLLFDLAAKLTWEGGEDVYTGGKRDVATLYEYWVFFALLDLVSELFVISPKDKSELIRPTKDGLGLQLRRGRYIALSGVCQSGKRPLNVRFSFNRVFSGGNRYPDPGSWTRTLTPDYTLSIWPQPISEETAEKEELIVHLHFDAKYRVKDWRSVLEETDEEEPFADSKTGEEKDQTYKRDDLLKMHAYKDAIRRTAGAYIIYPGNQSQHVRGFHEIVPSVGAFAVNPSFPDRGLGDLKIFLRDVTEHLSDRASQRESAALKTYQIYQERPPGEVKEFLPEAYGPNRSFIPDNVQVLIGFYKDADHLEWIRGTQQYNARTDGARGALPLEAAATGAQYLLLHSHNELSTGLLFRIEGQGPMIFSKEALAQPGYHYQPSRAFYLVYKISDNIPEEYSRFQWDISKLDGFKSGRGSGIPFVVTLTQLMEAVIR